MFSPSLSCTDKVGVTLEDYRNTQVKKCAFIHFGDVLDTDGEELIKDTQTKDSVQRE